MIFLLISCSLMTTSGSAEVNKDKIKIGLFIPGDIGGWAESKSLIPMAHVARDQINNSTDVLGDYDVELTWFNTEADPGKGIRELFSFIGTKQTRDYVGIVGPVFTDVTKYISELAPFFNFVAVSPTASSSSFSRADTTSTADYEYSHLIRLHPIETDIYTAIFQLVDKCNWTKIHILSGEEGMGEFRSSVINVFADKMKEQGRQLYRRSFTASLSDTIRTTFQQLIKDDARILIANFREDEAYDVFCIAKETGFVSESPDVSGRRVWVLPSSYSSDWIDRVSERRKRDGDMLCTKQDIIETVGTYLSPDFQWNTTEPNLDTGYSFTETWDAYAHDFYTNYKESCEQCSIEAKAGSLMYDSVWTLAKGLHNVLYRFDRASGDIKPWESEDNNAEQRGELLNELLVREGDRSRDLLSQMLKISFEGASGKIEFENRVDTTCRSGLKSKITQLKILNTSEVEMVEVCHSNDKGTLLCHGPDEIWGTRIYHHDNLHRHCTPDDRFLCMCPSDGPIEERMEEVIIGIPKTSILVFTVASVLGIALSVCFFIFNIVHMQEKVIKMSSPHINNIILLGAVLLYLYVPLYALRTGVDGYSHKDSSYLIKICSFQILSWVLCIGFTTSFGALFAKTWRVYKIFTSKKPKHMILSDWKLLILIGLFLLVDIILLGTNEYLNRYEWKFQPDETATSLATSNLLDDTPNKYGHATCQVLGSSPADVHWLLSAAFIYKGLLLIFGAFIAFQTRNICIAALNDSKFIGISIYTIVVVAAIAGPVAVSLQSQPALRFGIQAAGILFTTTVMICLVFLPKAYQLRYQPREAVVNRKLTMDWGSGKRDSKRESEIQNLLTLSQQPSRAVLKSINGGQSPKV